MGQVTFFYWTKALQAAAFIKSICLLNLTLLFRKIIEKSLAYKFFLGITDTFAIKLLILFGIFVDITQNAVIFLDFSKAMLLKSNWGLLLKKWKINMDN